MAENHRGNTEDADSASSQGDWDDLHPEEEQESLDIISLFDGKSFSSVNEMLAYTASTFGFDMADYVKRHELDFYERIKLVNYIRSEVKQGNKNIDFSKERFEADSYLQPVLEDDALLFSIDEVFDDHKSENLANNSELSELKARIKELEDQLTRSNDEFKDYRSLASAALERRWVEDEPGSTASRSRSPRREEVQESNYFGSYAFMDIHDAMLKDDVRTSSYEDFVSQNTHLFKDKVVLDVGCGTGILSMFCARAGATVYAVDNSDIIHKAETIIKANGLADKITLIKGKMEEIKLPVNQVDVIISEWMGYCLLFEAMLPSVLHARDRYLKPGGIMAPSHCAIHLAPYSDAKFRKDQVDYWKSVYGFNMNIMLGTAFEDVRIITANPEQAAGDSDPFFILDLYEIKTKDLTFQKPFSLQLSKDLDNLDGFLLWFDIFFLSDRQTGISENPRAETWTQRPETTFTTGPAGKATHWFTALMPIDRTKQTEQQAVGSGTPIVGEITYSQAAEKRRGLDVEITWKTGEGNYNQQLWRMQ